MDRLFLVVGGLAIAGVVAALFGRGRATTSFLSSLVVPKFLDRKDFRGKDKEWLVAVFSSKSCSTCAQVVGAAQRLASGQVEVQEIEFKADRELHKRYQIGSVPLVVFANRDGEVEDSILGPVSDDELELAMAKLLSQ